MVIREQVNCVVARTAEIRDGRLAIADIVADHRPASAETAVARAARAFTRLPGCEIVLTVDGSGGYLAFTRRGQRFKIRQAQDCGIVPASTAEACAAALYAWSCAGHPASLALTSSA